jgi:murein L,D-transpeptidase YafK
MRRRSLLLSCLALPFAQGADPARAEGLAGSVASLPPDARADRIIVRKSQREMTLLREGVPLKTYQVALGRGEPGPKRREGDGRAPEGVYRISGRNPDSAYHLSLRISYPEPHDVAAARARGEPPGGDVMVHGIRNGLGWLGALHRRIDWTAGCIAVTNDEIEEIWRAVPDGIPIEILS